ncbi:hypothetical protein [Radicibacter daui]|uniref:hypothetical protein n=1 Tax=Radicibacter daui TaxID=3064829 RepID=UPI00404692CF
MSVTLPPTETEIMFPAEPALPAVSWGAIIAGALAASTLTFILMLLGSGLGLTMVSPWANESASVTTFAVSTAIWLVIVQWLSAAVGGYLAGRLRTRWSDIHSDESYFRYTAHGFLSWALATLIVVYVLGSVLTSAAGTGIKAASTVAAGAPASISVDGTADIGGRTGPMSYYVDTLFRPANPGQLAALHTSAGVAADAAASREASRILVASAAAGGMTPEDKTYLSQLVAARTGLSDADATARIDAVSGRINIAITQAKEAADSARKAGATFALLGALSLIIGAFIASIAAVIAGRQRDDEEDAYWAST